jgi:ATP-dependent Lon protease
MSSFQFDKFSFANVIDEEAEFIPLMSSEDEEEMNKEETPEILPILTLRNTVLFPGVVIPITVGRDKSIKLIQDANKGDKVIGVVSQKDDQIEEPELEHLHEVGTIARILKMFRMPDGNTTVIIQGKKRFKLLEMIETEPYLKAKIAPYDVSKTPKDAKFDALVDSVKDMALKIIEQSPNIPSEASFAIKNIESSSYMINFIASNMNAEVSDKQKLLVEPDIRTRAELLLQYVTKEMTLL